MGPIGFPETSVSNYQSTQNKRKKREDLIYTAVAASDHLSRKIFSGTLMY